MAGRSVLVTGASDGIGAETAKVLAERGATVHVTGRSLDKLRPVAEAVGTEPLVADFSRLDDVRRLAELVAERVGTLDVLMNNAGGTFAPSKLTHDGHEPNFQINHLAPFLLTNLLHPALAAAGHVTGREHLQHRQPDRQDRARRPRLRPSPGDRVPGLRHRQADEHPLHPRHRRAVVRRRRRLGRRPPRPGRQLVRSRLVARRPALPHAAQAVRHDQRPRWRGAPDRPRRARARPRGQRPILQPLQPRRPREQAGPRPIHHRRPVGAVSRVWSGSGEPGGTAALVDRGPRKVGESAGPGIAPPSCRWGSAAMSGVPCLTRGRGPADDARDERRVQPGTRGTRAEGGGRGHPAHLSAGPGHSPIRVRTS